MRKGLDFAYGRPSVAALQQGGYDFVCRYISNGNTKDITTEEVGHWLANGVDLVLVFEETSTNPLGGFAQGVTDARRGLSVLSTLGAPARTPLYFAVDFDASAAQRAGPIADYFRGVATVIPLGLIGVYGSYYTVGSVMDAGLAHYGWQAFAWSGGRWYTGAHLQQHAGGTVGGVSVDLNRTTGTDFGQWPRPRAGSETDDMPLTDADVHKVAGAAAEAVVARLWTDVQTAGSTTTPIHQGSAGQTAGATYLKAGDIQGHLEILTSSVQAALKTLLAAIAAVNPPANTPKPPA